MGVSINGGYPKIDGLEWNIHLKMDDKGVPPFQETSKWIDDVHGHNVQI